MSRLITDGLESKTLKFCIIKLTLYGNNFQNQYLMQALDMTVTDFFMLLSLYVLCQSCVSLVFGDDENFNPRPNHWLAFLYPKVIKV